MNGISHFEESKDGFGYRQDQIREELAEMEWERKRSAIQDTVITYWNKYNTMVEIILNIDENTSAEDMYQYIINLYINLDEIERTLKFSTNPFLKPEKVIQNIKSMVIESIDFAFPDSEMKKLKSKILN